MAADWLGFEAGSLLPGDRADVTVIDPNKLSTHLGGPVEDYDARLGGSMRLVKRSDGVVKHVFINGEPVFTEGIFHPQLGQQKFGQLLRSKH
ncbi:MAG: hypothetical protein HC913_11885 [Microscillaceae bacterium]|nr:hypothetical protein [Microscillaceae bacterium]